MFRFFIGGQEAEGPLLAGGRGYHQVLPIRPSIESIHVVHGTVGGNENSPDDRALEND